MSKKVHIPDVKNTYQKNGLVSYFYNIDIFTESFDQFEIKHYTNKKSGQSRFQYISTNKKHDFSFSTVINCRALISRHRIFLLLGKPTPNPILDFPARFGRMIRFYFCFFAHSLSLGRFTTREWTLSEHFCEKNFGGFGADFRVHQSHFTYL